jgi:hypothetical protein
VLSFNAAREAAPARESAPRYDPRGWMHWPANEDYSYRFMQVLGTAQEGSSTISKCFLTATRITSGDDESWYREWKKIADTCKSRGDLALQRGNANTASSHISSRLKRDAMFNAASVSSLTEAVVVLNRAGGDASRRHLAREAFDIA